MATGQDAVNFAKKLVGRPYVLGANVQKDNPDYSGAFDCAEFVAFTNYQVFGILYGCDSNSLRNVRTADAYTGYFKRDAEKLGKIITVDEAASIPGAMILRFPAPGAVGHIVFSQGNGNTVEANCTKYGCIESVVRGRRFDIGILLPGVAYHIIEEHYEPINKSTVYKLEVPNMKGDFITKIQSALGISADGIFGIKTNEAIIAYQKKEGLVADGEVMPGGQTARSLGVL